MTRTPGVETLRTPAFAIQLSALEDNCRLLQQVQRDSGAKILLALKGFAAWSTFGLIGRYLSGVTSSGPFEAKLGAEKFPGEVHCYAPAYSERDVQECLEVVDHLIFNSFEQWQRFRPLCEAARGKRHVQFGMRINPEHSEVKVPLYDPCRPGSRLGTTRARAEGQSWDGLDGLHFHTLCELDSDALERTLKVVEANWADAIAQVRWVNFGGGHHITRPGYDVERLVRLVREFRARWGVDVYLEPGEAIALNAGVLVASVLDLIPGPEPIAMLDVSATAHMPDVLEMPYRPRIDLLDEAGGSVAEVATAEPGELPHTYQLGGVTCLAGDVIGRYSFHRPLKVGDRLVFRDMAIYTMVKTTMFNGVRHPDIVLLDADGSSKVVREFTYEDYRARLS
ncbi:MAG TPA: carboxynorspermidine decarboxylase [Polyangiaceae bacterium]|nr:carboxynorspermidine decarboxylase [Polyangiaceae bacterium]